MAYARKRPSAKASFTCGRIFLGLLIFSALGWLAVLTEFVHRPALGERATGSPAAQSGRAALPPLEAPKAPEAQPPKSSDGFMAGRSNDVRRVSAAPTPRPSPSTLAPTSPSTLAPTSKVSCGGHFAPNCKECTAHHQADSSWCNGDCVWELNECLSLGGKRSALPLEDVYKALITRYCFQPVRTDKGAFVNIILVRSPFRSTEDRNLYEKYKDKIVFIGISSFEDFPQPPLNPYSSKYPENEYVGLFPGFLHMVREPEKVFPSHVKLLRMSQSDFALPGPPRAAPPIKYDFTFSGSDQEVANDCVGWSSFAKNWSFVKEALGMMCGELGMTGVLVATKDKADKKACTIPPSCEGKMKQTTYLDQGVFFDYVKQSRFVFVPQVHDASPRVTTQALALGVPLLMNWNIMGGWKYVNNGTGEFFHDMSDLRASIERITSRAKAGEYQTRKYVDEHYGDANSGPRLLQWVQEHFGDRVEIPTGTKWLLPSGA